MLKPRQMRFVHQREHQRGFSLLEVLVTILILAFGLLGLGALQAKIQLTELESYQRGQAILVLSEMVDRINSNRSNAASYVTANVIGTGDSQPADCTTLAMGQLRDTCEWSNSLKGASEKSGTSSVGAMVGARGCITQIQAANPAAGVCTPGIYRVAVSWQGMYPTLAPAVACANTGPPYAFGSDDKYRRTISTTVIIGQNSCS